MVVQARNATRRLNGVTYKEVAFIPGTDASAKRGADREKEVWNKSGYNVRLIKSATGILICIRKKGTKRKDWYMDK